MFYGSPPLEQDYFSLTYEGLPLGFEEFLNMSYKRRLKLLGYINTQREFIKNSSGSKATTTMKGFKKQAAKVL